MGGALGLLALARGSAAAVALSAGDAGGSIDPSTDGFRGVACRASRSGSRLDGGPGFSSAGGQVVSGTVERLEEMIVRLSLLVFKIDMMQEEQK